MESDGIARDVPDDGVDLSGDFEEVTAVGLFVSSEEAAMVAAIKIVEVEVAEVSELLLLSETGAFKLDVDPADDETGLCTVEDDEGGELCDIA